MATASGPLGNGRSGLCAACCVCRSVRVRQANSYVVGAAVFLSPCGVLAGTGFGTAGVCAHHRFALAAVIRGQLQAQFAGSQHGHRRAVVRRHGILRRIDRMRCGVGQAHSGIQGQMPGGFQHPAVRHTESSHMYQLGRLLTHRVLGAPDGAAILPMRWDGAKYTCHGPGHVMHQHAWQSRTVVLHRLRNGAVTLDSIQHAAHITHHVSHQLLIVSQAHLSHHGLRRRFFTVYQYAAAVDVA
nr:MAG TPA: hypothetical protein [Caudoviricetes sp.]